MRANAIPATIALLVLLAGSSGFDTSPEASNAVYTLVAGPDGWHFAAAGVPNPTLVARAGQLITVVVRWSEGVHNLAVYPGDVPLERIVPGGPEAVVRSEPVTGSHPTSAIEFVLRQPGTYTYASEYRPASLRGLLAVGGDASPNRAPTIEGLTASPARGIPGERFRFRAVASDPDGDLLAVRWTYDGVAGPTELTGPGGGPIEERRPFSDEGAHAVRVSVSDGQGGTASAETVVTVSRPSFLRVTTDPAVPSMISVDGITRTQWGLSWMKIDGGHHSVAFSDVPGFDTPGEAALQIAPGETGEVVGRFDRLGFLRVVTNPAVPGTIYVDGVPRNDWGMWTAFPPGTYVVAFGPVAGYVPPPPAPVQVVAGELATVTGDYVFDGVSPGPVLGSVGYLRVTSNPAVPTRISLDGVVRDEWGLSWLKLPPGAYEVSATDVPGFGTPGARTVTVSAGETTVFDLLFAVHGTIRVTSEPAVATTIFVDGIPRDDWGLWRSIPAGTYEVSFGPVPGYVAPPARQVTVLAGGFVHVRGVLATTVVADMGWPSALAFAPDGRVFVAELYTGAIRILRDGALLPEPLAVLPNTATAGEQGLLGLALHPDFPAEPWLYAYQTFTGTTTVYNRVVRLRLDGDVGGPAEPVFAPMPASTLHNGGVIAFGPEGMLYVLVGDAEDMAAAQDPNALNGKVLRMTPEGVAPPDNPFVGQADANAYVYTLGHRNLFGIAFHPLTGKAYVTENGPEDSDEVNVLVPGGNYGWPIVRGFANEEPYIDPIAVYTPTIAPTNAIVYTGASFPEFYADLLFADWNTGSVRRLDLVGPGYTAVSGEAVVIVAPEGILDLEAAPDGAIWFTTSGAVFRWGGPP
jgi:quinoprotein glucose dehydrogenase